MKNLDIGFKSEQAVAEYFFRRGYVVIARNLRFHNVGEIDLVFLYMRRIIIVEVKSRRAFSVYGDVIEAVNPSKKRRIYAASKRYSYLNGLEACEFCFFVACVTHDHIGNAQKIEIFPF